MSIDIPEREQATAGQKSYSGRNIETSAREPLAIEAIIWHNCLIV